MKELYQRSSLGETLPELPSGTRGNVLIHEVLTSLNVLPQKTNLIDSESDQTSSTAQSSRASSVCESMASQPFYPDLHTPVLTTSPTRSSIPPSPPIPPLTNFEGFMNRLDDDQLQMMQNLPMVTPKAIEYPSLETFTEAYFMSHDFSTGPRPNFVNPRDTFQPMPFHMMHAYTT